MLGLEHFFGNTDGVLQVRPLEAARAAGQAQVKISGLADGRGSGGSGSVARAAMRRRWQTASSLPHPVCSARNDLSTHGLQQVYVQS